MKLAVARDVLAYGLLAIPAECKSAMLKAKRKRGDLFAMKVLEIILNLYADEEELGTARDNLWKYIAHVQCEYYDELVRIFPERTKGRASPGVDLKCSLRPLLDNQRAIFEIERRQPKFPCSTYFALLGKIEDHSPVFTEKLDKSLARAREAYLDLSFFVQVCKQNNVKPYLNPWDLDAEFMAAFAHVARALILFMTSTQGYHIEEISAARRHLTRVTLDLRKGIIFKACEMRLYKTLGNADLFIKARDQEVDMTCSDSRKGDVYFDLTGCSSHSTAVKRRSLGGCSVST